MIAELPRDEGGNGKCKGHHKSHIAEIEHRRVNHHRRMLQQRIQALPVSRNKRPDGAVQFGYQTVERAGVEHVQHQEKQGRR